MNSGQSKRPDDDRWRELRRLLNLAEAEMGGPAFWENEQRAAYISGEHARLSRELEELEAP